MCLIYQTIRKIRTHFYNSSISEIYNLEKNHFVYPAGKPMIHHCLRHDSCSVFVAKGLQ